MGDENVVSPAVDLRHIGRTLDKEMPIDRPGMEMSKPGFADMRRRKHTVPIGPPERAEGDK